MARKKKAEVKAAVEVKPTEKEVKKTKKEVKKNAVAHGCDSCRMNMKNYCGKLRYDIAANGIKTNCDYWRKKLGA